MAGKGKGKKKEKKEDTAVDNSEKKAVKGKKGKSKGKCNMDWLTDAAMDNVYYACHNVQDLLQARGYYPPDIAKKKKKGKR